MLIKNIILLIFTMTICCNCELIPSDQLGNTPTPVPPVAPPVVKENPTKKLLDASVTVNVFNKYGNEVALGSGVFVSKNIIATNFHVTEKGYTFKVEKNSNEMQFDAKIHKIDEMHDLALLKIEGYYETKPLNIQRNYPELGSDILVVGSPAGLKGTISNGIVSAIRKSDPYDFDIIQITAPISPGSSGGPVVNDEGEIIGISVAAMNTTNAQNLNFAVPAKYLEFLLD